MSSYPDVDDQTVFWRVMKNSMRPPIKPLGHCRDIDDDNQLVLFNSTLKQRNMVACTLDTCLFSSGMVNKQDNKGNTRYSLLKHYLKQMNEEIYSVHANWIIGNPAKRQAFQNAGLWIVGGDFEKDFGAKNCRVFHEPPGNPIHGIDTPNKRVNDASVKADGFTKSSAVAATRSPHQQPQHPGQPHNKVHVQRIQPQQHPLQQRAHQRKPNPHSNANLRSERLPPVLQPLA